MDLSEIARSYVTLLLIGMALGSVVFYVSKLLD